MGSLWTIYAIGAVFVVGIAFPLYFEKTPMLASRTDPHGTFVIGWMWRLFDALSLFKEICSCASVIIEVIVDTYYLCINVFHFYISCKCAWSLSKCICFVASLYYHSSYTSEKSMVSLEFHLFKTNQNWRMHIAPLHNDHNTTRYVYHHLKMLLLLMLMMIWICPSPWMSVTNED